MGLGGFLGFGVGFWGGEFIGGEVLLIGDDDFMFIVGDWLLFGKMFVFFVECMCFWLCKRVVLFVILIINEWGDLFLFLMMLGFYVLFW